jgi:hypothetical protein
MNARDSLAADNVAERAWEAALGSRPLLAGASAPVAPEDGIALALLSIAAELRAARVYANYLEGRGYVASASERATGKPTKAMTS